MALIILDSGNWIDIINIILTLSLTYFVFHSQRNYARLQSRREKPYLNFAQTDGEWKLYNFGGGAAIQLRFAEISYKDDLKIHGYPAKSIVSYGLPPNAYLTLTYNEDNKRQVIKTAHVLVATYRDIYYNEYLLYCRADTNHVFELKNNIWKGNWKDIAQSELRNIYQNLHTNTTRAGKLELTAL